jgi:hypothetical protein
MKWRAGSGTELFLEGVELRRELSPGVVLALVL